ncbi:MAG: tungsten ABC transporter substrate-binding protein, partial [Burkholderiaceae bacterium]|nr:tungsten ABC transporter substrate-binding protein [Burkholderiaceae bacterium]
MTVNPSICRLLPGLLLLAATAAQSAQTITLASTTSTEASGLFSAIVPAFRRDTGINVKVVAVGTGQAIDIARRGDAD